MLEAGDADGVISGLAQSYPDTIRPALQIVGTARGVKRVSGLYILILKDRTFFFADTTVNIDPTAEELAEIAQLTADAVKRFDIEPSLALISFSNFGSNTHEKALKVKRAVEILKKARPDLAVDGEMQADLAVVPEMLAADYPWANVQSPERPDLSGPAVRQRRLQARLAPCRRRGDRPDPARHAQPRPRPPARRRRRRHRQHGGHRRRGRAGEGGGSLLPVAVCESMTGGAGAGPHRSLWLQEVAGDAPDAERLVGSTKADVAIVGGGYVGLWTGDSRQAARAGVRRRVARGRHLRRRGVGTQRRVRSLLVAQARFAVPAVRARGGHSHRASVRSRDQRDRGVLPRTAYRRGLPAGRLAVDRDDERADGVLGGGLAAVRAGRRRALPPPRPAGSRGAQRVRNASGRRLRRERRHRAAGGAGAGPAPGGAVARSADLRAHEGSRILARPSGGAALPGGNAPCRSPRHRHQRLVRVPPGASPGDRRRFERHGGDRADSGPAARDRLGAEPVDQRFPDDGRLLSPDARRPHRLRQGRLDDCARGEDRGVLRSASRSGRRGARRPSAHLPDALRRRCHARLVRSHRPHT